MAKAITLYSASLDTENFSFEAYGETEQAAAFALFDGLARHGKQYGCKKNWFGEYLDSIQLGQVKAGCFYRDHEVV